MTLVFEMFLESHGSATSMDGHGKRSVSPLLREGWLHVGRVRGPEAKSTGPDAKLHFIPEV